MSAQNDYEHPDRHLRSGREPAQSADYVPHDHTTFVEGCFRCELSRDEVQNADYVRLSGYHRCAPCFIGQHEKCDGESRIHHVGGAVETVPCVCQPTHNDGSGAG